MDTSPTVPSKRLLLSYPSPASSTANHSPCISPLTGNSPLHHSFATSTISRKSSSQSESTPLSSPSGLNPFAVNYDSGNCEHWQSGGSSASSRGQSPLGIYTAKLDGQGVSLEDIKLLPAVITDDQRVLLSESPEITTEAPTPLSPKGLQFRHKPFPLSTSTLPSPIPRNPQGTSMVSTSLNGAGTSVSRSNPVQIPKHSLHHDRHLSPFSSGQESHVGPRHVRRKAQFTTSGLGTARQMSRSEPPLRSIVSSHQFNYPPSSEHRGYSQSSNRSGTGSPLSRLCVAPTGVYDSLAGACSRGSAAERRVQRLERTRRESETSNGSQEDGYMESDNSLVNSLEESLELCEPVKEYERKVATKVHS